MGVRWGGHSQIWTSSTPYFLGPIVGVVCDPRMNSEETVTVVPVRCHRSLAAVAEVRVILFHASRKPWFGVVHLVQHAMQGSRGAVPEGDEGVEGREHLDCLT